MDTSTAKIKAIRNSQGNKFGIGVSNSYQIYHSIKGFSQYDALFAAVETQVTFIGMNQSTAEQKTRNVLEESGIYPLKVRACAWIKNFFRVGIS